MSYGLPHFSFRDHSSRQPTTDQIIDARQKKHVEDAFISSQLVELGLLNPKHAVGKRAGDKEPRKGTGAAEAYPKKSRYSISAVSWPFK